MTIRMIPTPSTIMRVPNCEMSTKPVMNVPKMLPSVENA